MKKIAISIVVIISFYISGFFLATPLYLLAMQKDSSYISFKIGQAIGNYDDHANGWVVEQFGHDNFISQLRKRNAYFWCSNFEDCSVPEQNT